MHFYNGCFIKFDSNILVGRCDICGRGIVCHFGYGIFANTKSLNHNFADQNVTIKLDETAVVKMHNELRDTPKTGDDTNMKLWYVLAGLSAVGIAVTSVVAHKKKKKESNE